MVSRTQPPSASSNTRGIFNTAEENEALYYNTTGNYNTASGGLALLRNTNGNENTAVGYGALYYNTGSGNIALGTAAGENLTSGNNNFVIGNVGVAEDSGTIRIGTVGVPDGQLGVRASSARYKEAIKPMDKASEAILALKPVTFRSKHDLDPEGIPQFGFVAEEVEKVNPDLVARDEQGKPYTVRYEAVNAMLLNEFLKEHRKVEEQESKITQQDAKIAKQQKQIEALTTGLRKMNAQLELSRSTPQTAMSNW